MKRIRRSLFETNSSSTHSLTIGSEIQIRAISNEEIEIVVGNGEYALGYDTVIGWRQKADYLGIDVKTNKRQKNLLESTLKTAYPNSKILFSDDGYIDHQSTGKVWSDLTSLEDVYSCIFGDSKIIIDNDNH